MSRRSARKRRRFGFVFPRKWPSGRTTWSAQWPEGARRLTRNFDTEKQADDFLDEIERRVLAQVYETPPTAAEATRIPPAAVETAAPVPTFVEYAAELLKHRLAATLAPNTMQVYSANLLALSAFFGARDGRAAWRLDEITPASVMDYRAFRRTLRNHPDGKGGTVSAATINRDVQFLSRVLSEAVLDGHVERNALVGLKKLKEPRKPRRYLTKDEIALVVKHAPPRFRPLVLAAVYTGARKCELTRLRWSDIDFKGGKIALFRQKVGNADSLDLHPVLAEELTKLRKRRAKKGKVEDQDHVFLSRRGTAFQSVAKSWALTLEGAGLAGREGLTFHSLRHSFATHYLEGGGAVTDLQMQLGHADLSTTQRYAHALSERRRAHVLALDFTGTKTKPTKRSA